MRGHHLWPNLSSQLVGMFRSLPTIALNSQCRKVRRLHASGVSCGGSAPTCFFFSLQNQDAVRMPIRLCRYPYCHGGVHTTSMYVAVAVAGRAGVMRVDTTTTECGLGQCGDGAR